MPPSVLLEPIFTTHGDQLYRVALLITPDERHAARLLDALATNLTATPPLTTPTEVELLARLIAAGRAAEAKQAQQRRPSRNAAESAIYRSLHTQVLDQRLALGLHLLLGYDPARLAVALNVDPAESSQLLEQAMRAIAPAAGRDIPDRVSSDHCYAVRAALIDTTSRERHSGSIRSHLAGCAPCRSFDQRWIEVGQVAEEALRQELRPRRLPAELFNRLVAYGTPRTGDRLRPYRVAIPLVVVLALIAALVLPGFTQRAVTIVDRTNDPVTVDPNTLLTQALELHSQPPPTGPAIWHGRFETLWYFDERTFAPLHADLWLDRDNPARHRAQITHREGGAPYELQVGSGTDRLYYALDAAYAPVLYGGINTGALPERPRLNSFNSSPTEQSQALSERLQAGPWSIPPFYLEQALGATDLRVLGRQRDGERTVQIISFSGISPLSPPMSEPERVTVLLALDNSNGRLRNATELIGPPGGTQVSRITWRLIDEEQFEGELLSRRAFSIDSAWNGLGDFATTPPQLLADPALPFLTTAAISNPAAIVGQGAIPIWMPNAPPPGVERALVLGGNASFEGQFAPNAVVYLGPQRRLSIRYGRTQPLVGETLTIGVWDVTLRSERGNYYSAFLQRQPDHTNNVLDIGTTQLFVEARGFTRAELLAIMADLHPFDLESLISQDALFARPEWGDPAARQAILILLSKLTNDDQKQITYFRWRGFNRPNPQAQPPPDPYSQRLHTAYAADYGLEFWFAPATDTLTRLFQPTDNTTLVQQYRGLNQAWLHDALNDVTTIYPLGPRSASSRLPMPFLLVAQLLTNPDWSLELVAEPNGTQQIRAAIATTDSETFYLRMVQANDTGGAIADLQPETISTEVDLEPTGELRDVRVYAADLRAPNSVTLPDRVLIEAYELEEQQYLAFNAGPAELSNGAPPPASLVRDLSGLQAPNTFQVDDNLEAALALAEFPLYTLPATQARLLGVEQNLSVVGLGYSFPFLYNDTGDLMRNALEAGLAVRQTYALPTAAPAAETTTFQLTHGPAAALRAYLRSSSFAPWENPEPITLTLAGQTISGWIGTYADQTRLIVEHENQLLIIEAPSANYATTILPLLADLQTISPAGT